MRTAIGKVSILLAVALAAAPAARGQSVPDSGGTSTAASTTLEYPGVVPGRGNDPPRAARAARQNRAVLTWPGFQITENGTRIFVQSTKAVRWSRADSEGNVVVVIRDAMIDVRNNLHPLVTAHFSQTPVASAKLERHRGDVHLVIEMKAAATASVASESGSDGYHYLYVGFPPGEYLTPESNMPAMSDATGPASRDLGGNSAIRRGRSGGSSGSDEAEAGETAAPVESSTPAPGPAPAPQNTPAPPPPVVAPELPPVPGIGAF